jgi:hypothetical protein
LDVLRFVAVLLKFYAQTLYVQEHSVHAHKDDMSLRTLLDDAQMRLTPPFSAKERMGTLPYVTFSKGGVPDPTKSELVYVNAAKWSDNITEPRDGGSDGVLGPARVSLPGPLLGGGTLGTAPAGRLIRVLRTSSQTCSA